MHDRNVIESVNAISLLPCHEFVRITIPQSSGYFGRNSTRERIISKERVDASVSQTPFSFRKKICTEAVTKISIIVEERRETELSTERNFSLSNF